MRRHRKEKSLEYLLRLGKRNSNGCLEWQKASLPAGYGIISDGGEDYYVHRYVAWLVGIIPKLNSVFQVLHTCDNKKCYEPTHLKKGTFSDNLNDAWSRGLRKRKYSV
jgi:hypothetical protein